MMTRPVLLSLLMLSQSNMARLAAAPVDFATAVRPILNAHCVACHGGVKEAGDVSFIYRDKALGVGDSGKPTLIPGHPEASEMMVRIESKDLDEVMPKPAHGPPLSAHDIAVLRRWIKEGAKWGEHWSFVAPEQHPPPAVKQTDWPRRELDFFILARLEKEGLRPAREAGKPALLRRVSLDLTGLPPTEKELDQFLADESPQAYEKQVERLLQSPRFGERWASVWMDLARYADSEGLGLDRRREVWKYRDWLIAAFNRDLPYDQFTIEQLAGDLIPNATLDQRIATTFHRLTQANNEGGTDDEEFRVAAVMDRVATTWEVWQGVTMGCVQCHSHPYDPIQHEEYYAFMGFFNNSADADLAEGLPVLRVPINPVLHAEAGKLQDAIKRLEQHLYDLQQACKSVTPWQHSRGMSGSSKKAKLEITRSGNIEEFRTIGNVAAGAVHTLQIPVPAELAQLTAFRLEVLPMDEEKALHTPEWGAVFRRIRLHLVTAEGQAKEIPLAEVITDEAHPNFDPNNSLKDSNQGWGPYSKMHRPRHAVILPKEVLKLPAGSSLRITLAHSTGAVGGSFPLIAKRGRIALSGDPCWTGYRRSREVATLKRELAAVKKALAAIPTISTPDMRELEPGHRRATHVFVRGNWLDKGTRVKAPNTPAVFPKLQGTPDRLAMAGWIASPENPLTARVAVNRFWLELFGTGIVPTPEDFGSAGEEPTHPELLDTLAVRFQTDLQWSMKALLRELVGSAAYRQDARISPELRERDADNRLLARGPRQRLTGEMIRDNALTISGLLAEASGGPPVHPPLPADVWKPFTKDDWKTPAVGEKERYYRSVFVYWKRSIPYPVFTTFDAPARELCSKRRVNSNTPLQALTVLNDPTFHEFSQGLARRMKEEFTGDPDARLARAYRTATSREITAERLSELRRLFDDVADQYHRAPGEMKALADSPELAAYTVVASVLLNLDEALIR